MNILVVDDEEGIREGLASFLRHHGHLVQTAAACAEATAVLACHTPDVIVTDWRLTDGNAEPLLQTASTASLPVIVITGCPEEIEAGSAIVLRKPVPPDALLAQVVSCGRPRPLAPTADPLARLAPDVQDRIRLLLHGLTPVAWTVDVDGMFVTVTVDFGDGALPDPALLARLGGDWSLHSAAGTRRGRWRCYRDGRPALVTTVIGPGDAWPSRPAPFAIDLHEYSLPADSMLALLDRVGEARAVGREVHLLNVPGHLRLWLELLGKAHALPMRTCSGPRLSAVARQLWS